MFVSLACVLFSQMQRGLRRCQGHAAAAQIQRNRVTDKNKRGGCFQLVVEDHALHPSAAAAESGGSGFETPLQKPPNLGLSFRHP